ncbi:MAG: TrkA C-terminal domain-containing protein, partial [Chloroflexi bacterium]|nr:TrkA C-terminal domain-containing protein [Chloroflexota bacterium]
MDVESASGGQHVEGLLSASDIVRAYRETLTKSSRRMRGLVEGTVMLEVKIEPEMSIVNKALRDAHLPQESLVVSIRRQGELIFPRGSATIQPGDVVTFLVSPSGEDRLQQYLAERTSTEETLPLQGATTTGKQP